MRNIILSAIGSALILGLAAAAVTFGVLYFTADRGYSEAEAGNIAVGAGAVGYEAGQEAGQNEGAEVGYDVGYDEGYDFGYDDGYYVGYEDGQADAIQRMCDMLAGAGYPC